MYTQATTAMTTMLATTATAIDDLLLPLITLGAGLCLMWVGLVLWIYSAPNSDTPAPGDNSHRTQRIIGVVTMVIGLITTIIGINVLPSSTL